MDSSSYHINTQTHINADFLLSLMRGHSQVAFRVNVFLNFIFLIPYIMNRSAKQMYNYIYCVFHYYFAPKSLVTAAILRELHHCC